MSAWNGEERRQTGRDDHDVLTRIDANLSNFMRRFEDHIIEDKDTAKDVKNLSRYLWMGLGMVSLIVYLTK